MSGNNGGSNKGGKGSGYKSKIIVGLAVGLGAIARGAEGSSQMLKPAREWQNRDALDQNPANFLNSTISAEKPFGNQGIKKNSPKLTTKPTTKTTGSEIKPSKSPTWPNHPTHQTLRSSKMPTKQPSRSPTANTTSTHSTQQTEEFVKIADLIDSANGNLDVSKIEPEKVRDWLNAHSANIATWLNNIPEIPTQQISWSPEYSKLISFINYYFLGKGLNSDNRSGGQTFYPYATPDITYHENDLINAATNSIGQHYFDLRDVRNLAIRVANDPEFNKLLGDKIAYLLDLMSLDFQCKMSFLSYLNDPELIAKGVFDPSMEISKETYRMGLDAVVEYLKNDPMPESAKVVYYWLAKHGYELMKSFKFEDIKDNDKYKKTNGADYFDRNEDKFLQQLSPILAVIAFAFDNKYDLNDVPKPTQSPTSEVPQGLSEEQKNALIIVSSIAGALALAICKICQGQEPPKKKNEGTVTNPSSEGHRKPKR